MSKKNLLRIYLFYRLFWMLFAILVVAQFTSLGDSNLYMESNARQTIAAGGYGAFLNRTLLVKIIVAAVRTLLLGSRFLTHLFFNLLAYYGIRQVVNSLKVESPRRLQLFMLLLFLPTFNIWSGIAGKEAITVFAMGVITAQVIRTFNGERLRLNLLLLLSFYLIAVIKAQYLAAVIQLLLYIFVIQKFKIRGYLEVLFIALIIAVNVLLLYVFRDFIDEYSRLLIYYFRAGARSTRESPFVHPYDFFRLMPYGMFISLWGPKLSEARISVLHLFSFLESIVLFAFIFVLLKETFLALVIRMKIWYRRLFLVFNTLFWLFFAQYIQGILNPGSAVRYRTNFYVMLLALLYYLLIGERVPAPAADEGADSSPDGAGSNPPAVEGE